MMAIKLAVSRYERMCSNISAEGNLVLAEDLLCRLAGVEDENAVLIGIDRLVSLIVRDGMPGRLFITGGEPTDQAAEVAALLIQLREISSEIEVVCLTRLPWRRFGERYPLLKSLADVVVAGQSEANELSPRFFPHGLTGQVKLLSTRALRAYV